MPGHTSAHGSKSKSHGDTSRGPKNSPFSSGFQGARKTSTKTKTNNNNNRETYRTKPRTIDPAVKRRNELALKVAKQKTDAEAFKNYTYEDSKSGIPSGIGLVMDVTGLGKKGHEINKSYYQKNVIGRKKPTGGFYGASIEDYKGYMRGRGSGELDASGRTIVRGDGGGDYSGSFVVEKNVGGSTILTETKTEAEKTTDEEYDTRKTKRRGRRRTILTSQTGAGGNLVLGKPSLLGA
tara:strand:+ start:229 stop:939 length:711 start_codon:yes stop_codon:yes gene_type:complete